MTDRADDALSEAVARTLGVLRIFVVSIELAVVAVWHSWYFSGTHLVVPAVAAVWGLVFAAACLRNGLSRPVVVIDFLVALLLAATATQSLDPAAVERGPNWLLFRLVGTSVAIAWSAPLAVWLAATGVLAVAVGASYASADLPRDYTVSAVVLVVVAAMLLVFVSKMPRRGAIEADAALARAGARRQAQEVAAMRQRDLRENERVLHDTVLNTLTALGWGATSSPRDLVRARCRQSVAVCTDFLASTSGSVGVGGHGVGASLVARLHDAVEQARRDGLRVDVTVTGEPYVPVEVGAALAAAVRESLSNVRRHAGTMHAWLDVRADGSATAAAAAAAAAGAAAGVGVGVAVTVTVRDKGPGFDPTATAADRLGLRNSIVERLADVDGAAEVRTAPGRGTAVVLRWSPDPVSASAVVAETAQLEAAYQRDAVRTVAVAALSWQCVVGLLLVMEVDRYSHPQVVVGAWALTLLALGWAVAVAVGVLPAESRRLRPTAAVAAVTAAVVVAQLVAVTFARHADLTSLTWMLAVAEGVVCFVAVSRPARAWVPASGLMIGVPLVVVGLHYDADVTVVTRVTGPLYLLAGILVALSMFGRSRRATIGVLVRAAQADADLAAERAAAVVVRRDRELRLRQLGEGPLPLLTGIGAGRLDPFDAAVRRECAAQASALRRTLTHQNPPTTLFAALEPAILAAERRGALVEVQAGGDLGGVSPEISAKVAGAVGRVLDKVAAGPVLVTLVGSEREGSLIVSFPHAGRLGAVSPARAPEIGGADVGGADVEGLDVVADVADGRACVEFGWDVRRPEPVHR